MFPPLSNSFNHSSSIPESNGFDHINQTAEFQFDGLMDMHNRKREWTQSGSSDLYGGFSYTVSIFLDEGKF